MAHLSDRPGEAERGAAAYAQRLAADLQARGILTDPRWRAAFEAVPRHLFVPAVGWAVPDQPGSGLGYRIDAAADPQTWWQAVYSDTSIITQRGDGAGDPADAAAAASSSISAPAIAFSFLELLAPRDHDRVLEIGTGTGYTAALLSARLGAHNVTSIEVDAALAAQAAANLATAGYAPHLVVGDGAVGHPAAAPYDRVHATCAVARIPPAWVAQTRPGGIIVAPWQPHIHHGWQVRLTVLGDEAYGRFSRRCGYMMLRGQRAAARWKPHHAEAAAHSTTPLDPRGIVAAPEVALATAARAPGLGMLTHAEADGSCSLLLFEVGNPDGAWAACDYEPGARRYAVTQYGERRLWEELEAAFGWWIRQGSPGIERFGLTVCPTGERLWLDSPSHPV